MTFDFTLIRYRTLLDSLIHEGYKFQTVKDYFTDPEKRVIILRQDVDKKPYNSLLFAKLQSSMGISSTFYFRVVPFAFNVEIIRSIAALGHEIGYHYEDIDLTFRKILKEQKHKKIIDSESLLSKSFDLFVSNLELLRSLYPVRTICMHGSPYSPFDNKMLWEKYNYRELGIIGEPYLDIDFSGCGYLSDTGRRWDGESVSIRDKVKSNILFHFRSTNDIISNIHTLPDKIMMTIHPQRWNNNIFEWSKEYVFQNIKNQIKKYLVKKQIHDNSVFLKN